MRKKLVFLMLMLTGSFALAQGIPNVSIDAANKPLQDVVTELENQSGYTFFYISDWFTEISITGTYTDFALDEALKNILKNTDLNFYISDSRQVFLTRNSVVYDALPRDFFGQEEIEKLTDDELEERSISAPLFANIGDRESSRTETVRIGKESRGSRESSFTLSGKATNFLDGEPVSDLAILLGGSSKGTVTNIDGFYSIRIPVGENIIETKGLGFRDTRKRVIIYNDGTLNFVLDESVEALDEVTVAANVDRNVKEALTGVTQIEIQKIKTIPLVFGERDILRAAISLPGITTAGETAAGFNVRGGRADQNLILLDDGVIYNPAHFFGVFSAINSFSTGSAEIYKGSIPAQFGGRLSSVFDLKTKDANKEKFSVEAAVGPVTSNAVLEIPIVKEKASLLVGGRGTYAGYILDALENEDLSNSEASFVDFTAKYSHALNENNEIKATGYFSRDVFSITSDSVFDYSNRLASFRWNHKFNEKNTGSLVFSNSDYQFNIEFDGESNTDFALGYRINETEVKLDFNYLHSAKHKFKYGIASKLYQVNPGERNPLGPNSEVTPLTVPQQRGLESAIYISDTYTISEKFLIDAGLRYSFFAALGPGVQRIFAEGEPRSSGSVIETQQFDTNEVIETFSGPEVRVSARYFLGQDFSIKGGYNNSFQYIHTLTSNTTVSPTDTFILSDTNLEPQRAEQFSLGLFKNYNGNEYEVSLEGFFKRQENLLDFRVGAQLLLNEQVETEVLQGDGRAFGVEFLIKKNEGRLNGWLGYTYSRSFIQLDSPFLEEQVNNGEFFPSNFDKPHDFSAVLNYKFTERFSASANAVYQTGRPVTFPIGNFNFNNADFVFFSDRNQFRIPDFYRLDLSFNIEGNHKIKKFARSFWSLSVYNVLGRNNPFSVFFATEDGEVRAFQSSIFGIPIPTLTYNFRF